VASCNRGLLLETSGYGSFLFWFSCWVISRHVVLKFMWREITNVVKAAASMLQAGSVPPNTPLKYKEDLSKINFLSSKKFYVVFWSVIILAIFYGISIFVLFLTASTPTLTVPFVSIFTETVKILAVIIASYLGVQTVLDFRMQSSSNVDLEASHTFSQEEKDEDIIIAYQEKYKKDRSYAPLEWIKTEGEHE
jgi:hypothetical protein